MSPRYSDNDSPRKRPLLRRADQVAVAALVLLSLAATGAWWMAQGGVRGRLIEIDRAARHPAQFRIDVNEADWPEISQLPGIGETLAKRIVETRNAEGPFADLDELRRVRGIGPRTLEQIRPYLRPVPAAGNVAGGAP